MATYQRGVATTAAGAIGLIQSIDVDSAVQEALAKDESGNTAVAEFYDPTLELSAEIVWDTSVDLPDLTTVNGTTVTEITLVISACAETAFNGKYYVTGVTSKETNEGYMTVSLKLKRFAKNSLPATT